MSDILGETVVYNTFEEQRYSTAGLNTSYECDNLMESRNSFQSNNDSLLDIESTNNIESTGSSNFDIESNDDETKSSDGWESTDVDDVKIKNFHLLSMYRD